MVTVHLVLIAERWTEGGSGAEGLFGPSRASSQPILDLLGQHFHGRRRQRPVWRPCSPAEKAIEGASMVGVLPTAWTAQAGEKKMKSPGGVF